MEEIKKIKVEILKSPAGKFLLPYSVKEKVLLSEDLANKLIKSKYAKKVR